MNMKTIYKKLITTAVIGTIIIGFSACSDDGQFKNAQDKIFITDCNQTGVVIPDGYISMLSGDTLVQEANNTVVTTYHDINGTKKVCADSGIAYLIR